MRVCSARYVPAFGRLGRRRSGPPDEHANGHPSTRTGSPATTPRPRPAPHAESRRLQLPRASRLLSTPLTATAGSLNTRVCCDFCCGMGAKYIQPGIEVAGEFLTAILESRSGPNRANLLLDERKYQASRPRIVAQLTKHTRTRLHTTCSPFHPVRSPTAKQQQQ